MSLKYPYGFIYEVTCVPTGRKYAGSHRRSQDDNDPDDSWYIGSSTNPEFWEDLEKYGKENFVRVIIEDIYEEDSHYLKTKECEYLKSVNARDNPLYYNLTVSPYGGGACINKILINNGVVAKFIYPEELESYISEGWVKGTLEEYVRKNSEVRKGRPMNPYTYIKLVEGLNKNNPMNKEENRLKVSKSKEGKIWVNNGEVQTYIDLKDLEDYLSKGYIKGMLKRSGKTDKSFLRICKVCNVSYTGGRYSEYCPKCYGDVRREIILGGSKRGKEI